MLFCISRSGSLHNVLHLYKSYYKTAVFVNLCCRWLVATRSTLMIDQKISAHYNRPCCLHYAGLDFSATFSASDPLSLCYRYVTDITVVWYTPQLVLLEPICFCNYMYSMWQNLRRSLEMRLQLLPPCWVIMRWYVASMVINLSECDKALYKNASSMCWIGWNHYSTIKRAKMSLSVGLVYYQSIPHQSIQPLINYWWLAQS